MASTSGKLTPGPAPTYHADTLEDRRRADQLAAVVEFSGDPIISSTPDGVISSWNPAAERLFGYTGQEIIGQPGILLSPRDRAEETAAVMARVRAGELVEGLETLRIRKDGTVFPVSVTVAPIRDEDGAVIGVTSIPRDVTEQKQAFEAAQRMAAIVETSNDAIISGSLDGTITSWNPAAERMYGYSREEVIGSSELFNSAEGRAGETHAILARIEAGQQVEPIETTRLRKDGTRIKVSLTYSPIHLPDGTVVGISTIARDLTDQQEAFEAAQRMESIIENSGEAIMGSTLDGLITSWNPAAERLFGYTREEMVGQHGCLISPDGRADVMHSNMAKISAGGQVERFEATRVRKDGAEIPILLTISPICDPDGRIIGASAIAQRRHRDAAGVRSRTVDDRVESGLTGGNQPRGQDHRRERGHGKGHRNSP